MPHASRNLQLNLDYILKFPLLLSHLWLHHHLHYSIASLKKMNGSIGFGDQQEASLGTVQVNLMLYESPTSSLHNCPRGSLWRCLSFPTRALSLWRISNLVVSSPVFILCINQAPLALGRWFPLQILHPKCHLKMAFSWSQLTQGCGSCPIQQSELIHFSCKKNGHDDATSLEVLHAWCAHWNIELAMLLTHNQVPKSKIIPRILKNGFQKGVHPHSGHWGP